MYLTKLNTCIKIFFIFRIFFKICLVFQTGQHF